MTRKLKTAEAARVLADEFGLSFTQNTLATWRCRGRGPAYVKIGKSVFYRREDLMKYAEGDLVHTSDSIGR